jgi:hypothetical protein
MEEVASQGGAASGERVEAQREVSPYTFTLGTFSIAIAMAFTVTSP